MIRLALTALAVGLALYLILLLLLYIFQRQLLYYPDQAVMPEAQIAAAGFAAVPVDSGTELPLRALWRPPARDHDPVILFFHGNAGSHYQRLPLYQSLAQAGAGVLGAGYPGYGGNPGQPEEDTLQAAGQSHYDWLQQQDIAADRIIIAGESLGSAIAVRLASRVDASGLVLLAPFTGMDDMAQRQFPYFPVRWLIKDRFRSIDRVADIAMPLIWIHGTRDGLIPFAMGKRLFAKARDPKTAHPIEEGDHNDLWTRGADIVVRTESRRLMMPEKDR